MLGCISIVKKTAQKIWKIEIFFVSLHSHLANLSLAKTTLVKHAFQSKPLLYFFVSSKTEAMICKEFQQSIESLLGFHIYGQVDKFASLLRELMIYSQQHHVTLMIDEFQRLYDINPAIMSEIQGVCGILIRKKLIYI